MSEQQEPKKRGRPRKNLESAAKSATGAKKKTTSAKKTAEKRPRIKTQGNTVFALDIGTRTIVGVLGKQEGEKFVVSDIEITPHPHRSMIDGQIEDINQVAQVVKQVKTALEKRNRIKLSKVSIAAAGRALTTKHSNAEFDVTGYDTITAEHIKSMEIETVQKGQKEVDKENAVNDDFFYCVGHTVVEYTLDGYKLVNLEGHKGKKVTMDIIAAFLPSAVVESLYAVMDNASLEISSLTLEPIAAMNVIIPPEIRLINIALVDIGAGTSDVAIAKDGSIIAYDMATTAGDEITEEIVKSFLVDFNTAEEIKMNNSDLQVEYKDIFQIPHVIKKEELNKKLSKSIDYLAETICQTIIRANDGPPQAVFLVGGGSQVRNLTSLIANKFDLDENRVAVGTKEFIKNVEFTGFKDEVNIGPELITPIGIGVTNHLNQGYDFSTITLNDEKIRIFNKKELSMFEVFALSGIKSSDIMGRSGRNLSFTLNGEKKQIKGKLLQPAEILVNEKMANINTNVIQGDVIKFKAAVNGEDGKAMLGEFSPVGKLLGTVEFGGENHAIGVFVKVNGAIVQGDYEIQNGDVIQVEEILTLGGLLSSLNIEMVGVNYSANNVKISDDYTLSHGDIITFENEKSAESMETEEIAKAISVTLNGKKISLPIKENLDDYLFLDLFNYVNFDIAARGADIVLTLNGKDANFTDILSDGDEVVIL